VAGGAAAGGAAAGGALQPLPGALQPPPGAALQPLPGAMHTPPGAALQPLPGALQPLPAALQPLPGAALQPIPAAYLQPCSPYLEQPCSPYLVQPCSPYLQPCSPYLEQPCSPYLEQPCSPYLALQPLPAALQPLPAALQPLPAAQQPLPAAQHPLPGAALQPLPAALQPLPGAALQPLHGAALQPLPSPAAPTCQSHDFSLHRVLSWCMLAQHFPRSYRVPMLPTCTGGGGHVTRYKNGSCFWWLPSTYTTHFIAAHSASKRLSLQALTHQRGACAPSSGPPSFKHAGASARVHTYAATERFGGTEPACTSRVPVWLVRIPIPPASFSISPSPPEQHKRH
jgi:hypothetical protein